jgi:hypothetical protein
MYSAQQEVPGHVIVDYYLFIFKTCYLGHFLINIPLVFCHVLLNLSYLNMAFKRKELSIFERGEVVGTWKCEISERKIGEALNHPQNTIHDVISAYKI